MTAVTLSDDETREVVASLTMTGPQVRTMPPNLCAALVKAQAEYPTIAKTKEGKVEGESAKGNAYQFTYSYADIALVVDATREVNAKYGLAVMQWLGDDADDQNGYTLTSILIHESGESISETVHLNAVKNTPQGIGSVLTYFRRYTYCAILGIVSDVDTDAPEHEGGGDHKRGTTTRSAPSRARGATKRVAPATSGAAPSADGPSASQLGFLNGLLTDLAVPKHRPTALGFASRLIGRDFPVESSKEFTKREASKLIDTMVALRDDGYTFGDDPLDVDYTPEAVADPEDDGEHENEEQAF
jgi:hypothetical protein